jgi:hypothetical protein
VNQIGLNIATVQPRGRASWTSSRLIALSETGVSAFAWTAALLGLVFFVFVSYLIDRLGAADLLYNSDVVQPYLMVGDIIRDPSSFFSWDRSAALYSFPDWFLAATLLALPVPNAWLPLIYGALLLTLYALAGGALLATSGEIKPALAAWSIAFILVAGGLATLLFPQGISSDLYVQLAAPYVHTGAALAALAAAALFLHLLQRSDQASTGCCALGLLAFAASFSDPLFCVWLVAPAGLTGLLHTWATRKPRGAVLAVVVVAAALAGWVIQRLLHNPGFDFAGSWSASIELLSTLLANNWGDGPLLLIGLLILALLLRGALLAVKLLRRETPTPGQTLELLLAAICAAALSAPVVANMITDAGKLRYFLILMLVPSLWVCFLLLRRTTDSPLHRYLESVPVALLLLSFGFFLPAWSSAKRLATLAPLEACLEGHGLTAGLGDYWTAKATIFESDRRIHLVQLKSDGGFYLSNFNGRWAANRADGNGPLRPNFIVPRGLDPVRLRNVYGAPHSVIDCAGQEVWLYQSPLLSFAHHLEKHHFTPADKTKVGVLDDGTLVSNGAKGFLYYGPFAKMGAGTYDLIVYGSGHLSGSGWVDVVSAGGKAQHAKMKLVDSHGGGILLQSPVTLERPVGDLEVRVYVGQSDSLRLTGYEVRAR